MPDHLRLPAPVRLGSRRANGGGGGSPKRERKAHGHVLQQQLHDVVAAPRRLDAGIDPELVFKIRATGRLAENALEIRALEVLAETADYCYFMLTEDSGVSLAETLEGYTTNGSMGSLLDSFETIEPYGAEDRLGPGLSGWNLAEPPPAGLFDPDDQVLVDVTIWAARDYDQAMIRARTVETVLARSDAEIQLRAPSARRNLLRVRVSLDGLRNLLDTSVVEQVRTPPVPFLDFRDWRTLSTDEIKRSTVASAVVGVLDDAPATAHPLLVDLISSIDLVGPSSYSWQQAGHHGTEVVGRVLFPDLHTELRDQLPLTAHGTVRIARILEPDPKRLDNPPRFSGSAFPHELVEQGIRLLHDKYRVRVFNLSVGYADPYNNLHLGEMSGIIDELVRELDIVVVVPTGNAAFSLDARTASGHHVSAEYPVYLDAPEHRLSEPGPAALAVTVGSIAHSDAVAEFSGNRLGWQAVAPVDALSPFSRTGPGIGTNKQRQNKPDVVHYGGNTVVNDSDLLVINDMGAQIVSTALHPDGRLFAVCSGTSFAAPAVARIAADIAHAYPNASANLIRALLAHSAQQTEPATTLISQEERRAARYGLGKPDTGRAITSGKRRATMVFEGTIPVDDVHVHSVPVPEVFRRGSGGERSIIATLAFDPPVRRQRREYLAAHMQIDLYRNIAMVELQETLRKQDLPDKQALITDRRHPNLVPGSNSVGDSSLQTRRWTAKNTFVNDDENFFVVVTHRAATWARNDPTYLEQHYALTVTLHDEHLVEADLHQLLSQTLRLSTRVRL